MIKVHNQLTLSKGDYPNLGEPDPISSKALANRAEASRRKKKISCLWTAASLFAQFQPVLLAGLPSGLKSRSEDLPHVPPQLCKHLPCRKSLPIDLLLLLFLWLSLDTEGRLLVLMEGHTGLPVKPCLRSRWPSRPPGLPTVLPVGIDTSYLLLSPGQPGPGASASQGTAKLKGASKSNL